MHHQKFISIGMTNECSLFCSWLTDFKPTHHRNLGKRLCLQMRGGGIMYAFCGELSCYKGLISWYWFIWMAIVIHDPEYYGLKSTWNARVESYRNQELYFDFKIVIRIWYGVDLYWSNWFVTKALNFFSVLFSFKSMEKFLLLCDNLLMRAVSTAKNALRATLSQYFWKRTSRKFCNTNFI